ncbi:MAG: hypothetical protein LC802_07875 [Acidobacteria bacterium]|nr:hypothetical protein [Acidobacteriota bacterium]
MKRIKRVLFVLLAGFLAFAPPGTLILGLILVIGLFRNSPLAVGGVLALAALIAAWLLWRRRAARRLKSQGRATPGD